MYKGLSPGAIGVRPANLDEAIQAAVIGGFQGVEVSAHEAADLVESIGAEAVKAKFTSAGAIAAHGIRTSRLTIVVTNKSGATD